MSFRYLFYLGRRFLVLTLFLGVVTFFILVAYGYRYDRQEHKLQPTGLVIIDGSYSDLSVSLDGVVVGHALPLSIPGVNEGYHHLALARDGYLPWNRDIQVTQGMVTSVPFIILLSDKITTPTPSLFSTKSLFSFPAQLVATSSDGFLFQHDDSYVFVERATRKKTTLVVPKNLQNLVFNLSAKQGYGFTDSFLRKFHIDLTAKKIIIDSQELFSYSREGLSFVQFSPDFKEFLFLKGGEITSILLNSSRSNRLFTRLAATVNHLWWYRDTKHFVLQVGQKLEFCDDTFSNCYVLRELAKHDSFSITRDAVYIYDSAKQEIFSIPLFIDEHAFLSYIFSQQASL